MLAVGAGGGCLHFVVVVFSALSLIFSPCVWEMVRYRLRYCLEGLLSSKQPPIASQLRRFC